MPTLTQVRYGPPVLTPNDSCGNTPRSSATTRQPQNTQDDEAPADDEYKPPTVEDCIYLAYNFERDYRVRAIPPLPEEDHRKADVRKKRTITKTQAYRAKRAKQSPAVQRKLTWYGIIRLDRKAAAAGRVQFWAHLCFLLFMLIILFFNRVVGTSDYTRGGCPKGRMGRISPVGRGGYFPTVWIRGGVEW